jgi:hypothetical protein
MLYTQSQRRSSSWPKPRHRLQHKIKMRSESHYLIMAFFPICSSHIHSFPSFCAHLELFPQQVAVCLRKVARAPAKIPALDPFGNSCIISAATISQQGFTRSCLHLPPSGRSLEAWGAEEVRAIASPSFDFSSFFTSPLIIESRASPSEHRQHPSPRSTF